MRLNQRIIQRLPKADLHCHLDGCVRPRTMLELAQAQGIKLPTRQLGPLTRHLQAGPRTTATVMQAWAGWAAGELEIE